MTKPKTISEYIAVQDERYQPRLNDIYHLFQELLPDCQECLSWGMPTFKKKHNIIHFACNKNHIGIYPGAEAIVYFSEQLKDYRTSKGALQLPHKKDLPIDLLKEIALWCNEHNDE